MIVKIKGLLFEAKSIRGTILKNFLWLLIGSAGSRLLKAIIIIYAARKLGVEGYGVFSYALGLAGFFVFFKNIGVDSILTREVAKKPDEQRYYLSTAFWIEIILLIITILLIIFITPLFSGIQAAIVLLPFIALILVFDDLKDFFIAFFRGREKMELEAFVVVVGNIALLIFGFIALYFFPTPKSFAIANMLASLVGVIIAIFLLKQFIRGIIGNFTGNLVMPILKSAWPFAVGGFASLFLFNIDIVMIGWWRGVEEVGLYSAAQKIVGILTIFSGFIATAIFPSLTRFADNDKQKMIDVFESALRIMFIFVLPLIVGGIILKDSLIVFLFGLEYLPAVNVFTILLFSILALYPMPIFSNLLFVFDKQSKMIKYAIVSSVCNIIFNYLFIPRYGMEGAAFATLISFFVYIILLWLEGKKIYNFNILSELFRIFLAVLAMGIIAYILKIADIHVLINIIFSGTIYFLVLYSLKEPLLKEIISFLKVNFSKK